MDYFYDEQIEQSIHEYENILYHNKCYQQEMMRRDSNYFKNLAKGQHPEYLLIGCADSRVPQDVILSEHPGEIFVHRNIANLILPLDGSANAVIQYACDHLKVKHIIVLGHTCCGGIKAALDKNQLGGQLDLWLGHIRDIIDKNYESLSCFSEQEKLYELTKLNVIEQVHNLWKNAYVQKRWLQGNQIWIHGWIFHVETGYIEDVILENKIPKFLSEAYKLQFNDYHMPKVIEENSFIGCFKSLFGL